MTKRKRAVKVSEDREEEVEVIKTQIGPVGERGVQILGHPCHDGMVIELPQNMIDAHRDGGVPLLDVPDDYDGEVYDVHVPYVDPAHESA